MFIGISLSIHSVKRGGEALAITSENPSGTFEPGDIVNFTVTTNRPATLDVTGDTAELIDFDFDPVTGEGSFEIPADFLDPTGTFSLAEDATAGTAAGTFGNLTPGATLSLFDDAGDRVALDGTTIERGATSLDYETDTSHSFTLRQTIGTQTHDTVHTLTVTDVSEGGGDFVDDFSTDAQSPLTTRTGLSLIGSGSNRFAAVAL
jgi:hypothetical protein